MPNENEQITLGLGIDTSKAEQDIDTFINDVNKKVAGVNGKITFDTKSLNKSITKAIDTKSISQSITQAVESGMADVTFQAPSVVFENIDWGNITDLKTAEQYLKPIMSSTAQMDSIWSTMNQRVNDFVNRLGDVRLRSHTILNPDTGKKQTVYDDSLDTLLENKSRIESLLPEYKKLGDILSYLQTVGRDDPEFLRFISKYERQNKGFINSVLQTQSGLVGVMRSLSDYDSAIQQQSRALFRYQSELESINQLIAENEKLISAEPNNLDAILEVNAAYGQRRELEQQIADIQGNLDIPQTDLFDLQGFDKQLPAIVTEYPLQDMIDAIKSSNVADSIQTDMSEQMSDLDIDAHNITVTATDVDTTDVQEKISDEIQNSVDSIKLDAPFHKLDTDEISDTIESGIEDIDIGDKLKGFLDPRVIFDGVKNALNKKSEKMPVSITADPSNTKLRNVRGIDDPNKLHFENLKDPKYLAIMGNLQKEIDKITTSITKSEIAVSRLEIAHKREVNSTNSAIQKKEKKIRELTQLLENMDEEQLMAMSPSYTKQFLAADKSIESKGKAQSRYDEAKETLEDLFKIQEILKDNEITPDEIANAIFPDDKKLADKLIRYRQIVLETEALQEQLAYYSGQKEYYENQPKTKENQAKLQFASGRVNDIKTRIDINKKTQDEMQTQTRVFRDASNAYMKYLGEVEGKTGTITEIIAQQKAEVEQAKNALDSIQVIDYPEFESAPEYQAIGQEIETIKAEVNDLKETQQAQHDNYVKNLDIEKKKLEEQRQKRAEKVEQQEDTTHKALAGQKLEEPKKQSGGEDDGSKALGTLDAFLGKLGQVKSLSGAVSTVMMLLPEPLTTALGIIGKIVGALGIFKVVLAPIQKLLNGILGKLNKITKSVTSGGNIFEKVFNRLVQRLKNIMFYTVFANAVRKLKSEFENLLKTDAQVKTSLGQIKGNLMTAFAPIYTFVLPAIQRLLQALVMLSSLLARLSMGIFGKTAKESQGLAKSLEEQAKAGGGASNSLGHLDELNTDIAQGGGGGAGDIQSLYDGLKVSEELEALGERVRAMLLKFWQPFKESWDTYAQPTWEKIKTAFFTFADVGLSVGESFAEAWANGFGESILGHLWRIFGNIIDTFTGLVSQFGEAWDVWGDDVSANFFTILDTLLVHIENISASIKEWAENINFEPLLSGVNDVLAALAPFSDEIGEGLEKFFNDILLPLGKWIIEVALPKVLEVVAKAIKMIAKRMQEFNDVITPIWNTILKPLVDEIGQAIIDILDSIGLAFDVMSTDTENANGKLTSFQYIVLTVSVVLSKLLEVIKFVLGVIRNVITLFSVWCQGVQIIIQAIQRAGSVLNSFATIIRVMVGAAIKFVCDMFNSLISIIEKVLSKISPLVSAFSELSHLDLSNLNGDFALDFQITGNAGGGSGSGSGSGSGGKQGGKQGSSGGSGTPRINSASDYLEYQKKKVKIKGAATGTVVPPNVAPYLAVLGDNNQETEVVSPLSTMKQAMIEALQESGANGGSEVIQLSMDGDVLFKWIVEKNRQNYLQTHNNSLVY